MYWDTLNGVWVRNREEEFNMSRVWKPRPRQDKPSTSGNLPLHQLEKTYPASLGYVIQLNSQRHKKLIQVQRRKVKDVIHGTGLALAMPSVTSITTAVASELRTMLTSVTSPQGLRFTGKEFLCLLFSPTSTAKPEGRAHRISIQDDIIEEYAFVF